MHLHRSLQILFSVMLLCGFALHSPSANAATTCAGSDTYATTSPNNCNAYCKTTGNFGNATWNTYCKLPSGGYCVDAAIVGTPNWFLASTCAAGGVYVSSYTKSWCDTPANFGTANWNTYCRAPYCAAPANIGTTNWFQATTCAAGGVYVNATTKAWCQSSGNFGNPNWTTYCRTGYCVDGSQVGVAAGEWFTACGLTPATAYGNSTAKTWCDTPASFGTANWNNYCQSSYCSAPANMGTVNWFDASTCAAGGVYVNPTTKAWCDDSGNFGSANWNTYCKTDYCAVPEHLTAQECKLDQSITVSTPIPAWAGFSSIFSVGATASSGLPVVITVTGGCTLTADIVTMTSGVTACTVNYNQAGDTVYAAAQQVSNVAIAYKISQTITVTTPAPSSAALNSTFPVSALASSGLTVAIAVTGGCSIAGNTVTMTSSSTACTVTYDQTGDDNYDPALQITSVTVPALVNPTQVSVSANGNNTCALDSNGVHCWGDNLYGQTNIPTLLNPTQISVGFNYACALDSNGVHCWGDNAYGQADVPVLLNPVQVSAGVNHTCALDSTGVHCWGYAGYGQTNVPSLVNPIQVSAGGMHTCALDSVGVHCWGYYDNGQTDVPSLVNPVQVIAGSRHTCALDAVGLHCWGMNDNGQTNVPTLISPTQVSTGLMDTCALDNSGVHCWGSDSQGQSTVPVLVNPVQVSTGMIHACALDSTGVVCWGYNAAGETINVTAQYGSTAQTITVTAAPPVLAVLGSSFPVAATSSSGLPVSITATGGCTIAAGVVTVNSIDIPCTVHFNQAGNEIYQAAVQVSAAAANQEITLITAPPASAALNSAFPVEAMASSGLPVAVTASGGCTFASGYITMTSATTACSVTFNQAGNARYTPAPPITANSTATKANQTITVDTSAPDLAAIATTFPVTATASSGLSVIITAAGGCTVASGIVTMTSAITACTLNFNQAGNASYFAATQVTSVTAAAAVSTAIPLVWDTGHWDDDTWQGESQTITVTTAAPGNAVLNDVFPVVATASSGLPVVITATGGCSVTGNTVTMTSAFIACTLKYNQPGDRDYSSAPQITTITAADSKATQTITVTTPAPASVPLYSSFTVAATASSGLLVNITVSGGCWIDMANTITLVSNMLDCTVSFNQPGNTNYHAAVEVATTTVIAKANQTITVTTPAPVNAGLNSSFSVAATASSGLTVAITVTGGCSIAGGTVTITSAVSACIVNFDQAGNATYNAAPQVFNSVVVTRAAQTITVTTPAPATAALNSSFPVAATASSGLTVSITVSGGCWIDGAHNVTLVTDTVACTVNYNQGGNIDFFAAPLVSSSTTVGKTSQTITVTTTAPGFAALSSTFPVVATATSGLAVAITTSGGCTGAGTDSATVTMTGASCTVNFNQAGNATYDAAPLVTTTTNLPGSIYPLDGTHKGAGMSSGVVAQ